MNDSHDHEADQAEFEGTYYKLKSDTERLKALRETGSMLVAPKCKSIV